MDGSTRAEACDEGNEQQVTGMSRVLRGVFFLLLLFVGYDVTGPDTGRAVILAHGSSVPYYIWDSTAVALGAAGYRVVRYDRFGIGLSDRPDAAYDSTMFTRQLDDSTGGVRRGRFGRTPSRDGAINVGA